MPVPLVGLGVEEVGAEEKQSQHMLLIIVPHSKNSSHRVLENLPRLG
jgi:hypothetical protein